MPEERIPLLRTRFNRRFGDQAALDQARGPEQAAPSVGAPVVP